MELADIGSVRPRTAPGAARHSPEPPTSRSAIAWSSCAPHPAVQIGGTAANRTYPGFVPIHRPPATRDFNDPAGYAGEQEIAGFAAGRATRFGFRKTGRYKV